MAETDTLGEAWFRQALDSGMSILYSAQQKIQFAPQKRPFRFPNARLSTKMMQSRTTSDLFNSLVQPIIARPSRQGGLKKTPESVHGDDICPVAISRRAFHTMRIAQVTTPVVRFMYTRLNLGSTSPTTAVAPLVATGRPAVRSQALFSPPAKQASLGAVTNLQEAPVSLARPLLPYARAPPSHAPCGA